MKADLLAVVDKLGLTPNGLYILVCLQRGLTPKKVDVPLETARLEAEGWLKDGALTHQAAEAIAKATYLGRTSKSKFPLQKEDLKMVDYYRLLFPPGKLPSGSSSRASVTELKPRFEWFFARYPQFYNWNLVLQATALYIDEYEPRQFEFMRNSENFIYKQDVNKIMKSMLADYCQQVLDGTETSASSAPSIIHIPGLNGREETSNKNV